MTDPTPTAPKIGYCYLVECADGSFYAGWTYDPQRRVQQHNDGRGARYTRTHGPVKLVYLEEHPSRQHAMRREQEIKRLSHQQKRKLALQYSQQQYTDKN